ncbi:uncharacterized protein [Dermacentor albipictus]|uniref:uncharacterized protein n=1 Tax=Dermacentor albipictus TaxID=60249 RepID=UPI0031FDBC00
MALRTHALGALIFWTAVLYVTCASDPYAYLCKGPTIAINKKLNVSLNCTATCYNRSTSTWVNARLGDGRLCALVVNGSGDGDIIKRTGLCDKGSCVPADTKPLPIPDDCPAKYVKRKGIMLAEKCAVPCKTTGKYRKLRSGTRCWLNYQRKVTVPGVDSLIIDGVCKNGHCIITPPAVPLLKIELPAEGCSHLLASVNYTRKVASECNAFCPGREPKYEPLRNRTACALKTSFGWYKTVTEVGECKGGNCVKKDLTEFPQPHRQVSDSSHVCKSENYAVVKPGQITVVASCQVECSYSVFERRSYGVACLLEYSETKKGEKTYTLGICSGGFCTHDSQPRNITTQD